jgi:hypothetical protein
MSTAGSYFYICNHILCFSVCTPLGFVRLFGVVGQFLAKPQFLRDLEEEFLVAQLEEDCVRRRLSQARATSKSYVSPAPMCPLPVHPGCEDDDVAKQSNGLMGLQNGALQSGLAERLSEIQSRRKALGTSHTNIQICGTYIHLIRASAPLLLSLLIPLDTHTYQSKAPQSLMVLTYLEGYQSEF